MYINSILLELFVVDCKVIKLTVCVGISQCGAAGELVVTAKIPRKCPYTVLVVNTRFRTKPHYPLPFLIPTHTPNYLESNKP